MFRSAVPGATACLLALVAGLGCGGAQEPRDEDVWHSSSLQPSSVPPQTEGERELLARLDEIPAGQEVTLGGQTFVADEAYASASGRACRSITVRSPEQSSVEVRLACQGDAGWVFVPDVFGDDATQMAEAGQP